MDSSNEIMQNATPISQLGGGGGQPSSSSIQNATPVESGTSYGDILKSLDIARQQQDNPPQMQQQPPQMQMQQQPQMQMQMQQQPQMQMTPQMQMQQMPQSAPLSSMMPVPEYSVQQSPLMSNLLPDPMFFQPPPPPAPVQAQQYSPSERRRKKYDQAERASESNSLKDKFDMNKIKPAILVSVIVFALLSWGAPVIAKRLAWTVDAISGKFTHSGLVVISVLTGGVFLGISEIIRNFGTGL